MDYPPNILLLAATKPEWSFLKKHFTVKQLNKFPPIYELSPNIHLLQLGIGATSAAQNLALLPEILFQNSVILHIGYSGALIPSLKTGDLITPTEDKMFGLLKEKNISVISGDFYSSPVIVKNKQERETLHAQTKAIAVDMEHDTVKKWALAKKLSYQALRVIFDELEEDISFLAENPMVNESGDLKATKAVAAFVKKPKNILSIPHIQKMANIASRSLENALLSILPR